MGERKMPDRVNLGEHVQSVMLSPMHQRDNWIKNGMPNPHNLRVVMGYYLPEWQRGLVWTDAQKIALIESAWRGLSIGTYTYNRVTMGHKFDDLLIDGQQRMNAIQDYLDDKFKVFGFLWSDVTETDRRVWGMSIHFNSYITATTDEQYLRDYYNMMNFGGVAHKESERA